MKEKHVIETEEKFLKTVRQGLHDNMTHSKTLFSCTFPNEVLSPGSKGEDDIHIPGGVTTLSFEHLTTTLIN